MKKTRLISFLILIMTWFICLSITYNLFFKNFENFKENPAFRLLLSSVMLIFYAKIFKKFIKLGVTKIIINNVVPGSYSVIDSFFIYSLEAFKALWEFSSKILFNDCKNQYLDFKGFSSVFWVFQIISLVSTIIICILVVRHFTAIIDHLVEESELDLKLLWLKKEELSRNDEFNFVKILFYNEEIDVKTVDNLKLKLNVKKSLSLRSHKLEMLPPLI